MSGSELADAAENRQTKTAAFPDTLPPPRSPNSSVRIPLPAPPAPTTPNYSSFSSSSLSSDDGEILVTVAPFTGGPFTLKVSRRDSVEDLKKTVAKRLKVLKDRICLLYRER